MGALATKGACRLADERQVNAGGEPHEPVGVLEARELVGRRGAAAGRQLIADRRLRPDAGGDQHEAKGEGHDRRGTTDREREPGG